MSYHHLFLCHVRNLLEDDHSVVLVLRNREEGDKCSVLFSIEHRAGALFNVLEVFAKGNINLTRIGSIQSTRGSYTFFVDFMGSNKDENVIKALEEVRKNTTNLRFLGCYREINVA